MMILLGHCAIIGVNNERKVILGKIQRELNKLHFKYSYHGTQYLIEPIYEVYKIRNKLNLKLSKDIYPIIAKKYNKSIDTIHSNMKKSVTAMYYDCDEKFLKEYFNYYETLKPKLKDLIFKIVDKISK